MDGAGLAGDPRKSFPDDEVLHPQEIFAGRGQRGGNEVFRGLTPPFENRSRGFVDVASGGGGG